MSTSWTFEFVESKRRLQLPLEGGRVRTGTPLLRPGVRRKSIVIRVNDKYPTGYWLRVLYIDKSISSEESARNANQTRALLELSLINVKNAFLVRGAVHQAHLFYSPTMNYEKEGNFLAFYRVYHISCSHVQQVIIKVRKNINLVGTVFNSLIRRWFYFNKTDAFRDAIMLHKEWTTDFDSWGNENRSTALNISLLDGSLDKWREII